MILLLLALLVPRWSWAYPEFIGYKYSSCLTCHYNGLGNGPLNDYGRALWSAEIAGRAFAGNKTDEELGEASGFLGKKEIPWWVRPGLKLRQLNYQVNPGGTGGNSQSILMQADANVALFADQAQKYAFIASFGYVPEPIRLQNSRSGKKADEWISREHYFRVQISKSLWTYVGMMDKAYGIRIVNHTAYSRAATGLAQNDQSHGVIVQYVQPTFEGAVNVFMGNMQQDEKLRQKGGSGTFEYEVKPDWRVGASLLSSTSYYVKNTRVGIHSRTGLGRGSALLFEGGLIMNTPQSRENKDGYYIYAESMQKLWRGYHVSVTAQGYKDELKGSKPDIVKTGIGLLAFPMARTEFRFDVENKRQMSSSPEVDKENWYLMTQVHLSF